ncbi:hypothetical protein [Perlabentimonas gracilis]|uniref:hypothetical protein n=1 Tax=Perlabentimonas gracilis TaxID=2715279 RepID=UPI001407DC23|nr:hypothetical protein [Perlabentimonas gracilis]
MLIFSALIFGAIHFYSSLYIVATFFSGLVYMVGYISRANISTKHAYWIIVAVHALNNLLIIGLHSLADLIPSS